MQVGQGLGQLSDDRDGPFRGQRSTLLDQLPDVAAVDEFLGDEVRAVGGAGFQDVDQVGVFESPGEFAFELKAADEFGVVRLIASQQLDRDFRAGALVAGQVDRPHAAGTQQA